MAAWIKGQAAAVGTAVKEAASILASARAPAVVGLAADVDALRAAFSLAARIGASLDPVGSAHLYADLRAFASAGGMRTTPSELLQRADLVLAVGARAAESAIVAAARAAEPHLGRGAGSRRVVVLDDGDGGPPLPARIGLLRAATMGRLAAAPGPVADLAPLLPAARFGVAVYDPADLGELAIEMLQGLMVELNATTRFFTLPLADPWQGAAALQVGAWTAGTGPRVGFGRGFPEHDPWRFDAARQAREGEIDAALWVAPLQAPPPAWLHGIPAVSLVGDPDGAPGKVVFAVRVPGRTCGGVLWDERRGTLAFAAPVQEAAGPTAAAILRAIEDAVALMRTSSCSQ